MRAKSISPSPWPSHEISHHPPLPKPSREVHVSDTCYRIVNSSLAVPTAAFTAMIANDTWPFLPHPSQPSQATPCAVHSSTSHQPAPSYSGRRSRVCGVQSCGGGWSRCGRALRTRWRADSLNLPKPVYTRCSPRRRLRHGECTGCHMSREARSAEARSATPRPSDCRRLSGPRAPRPAGAGAALAAAAARRAVVPPRYPVPPKLLSASPLALPPPPLVLVLVLALVLVPRLLLLVLRSRWLPPPPMPTLLGTLL